MIRAGHSSYRLRGGKSPELEHLSVFRLGDSGGVVGLGRIIGGAAVVGGVAIFGGTAAMDDNTTRDESGEIIESGGVGAFAVRVGDCVQLPTAQLVQSMEGVPCGSAHDAEAFATFDVTGEDYVEERVGAEAERGCLARWTPALGTSYEDDQELDLQTLTPTAESWAEGDREIMCFVVAIDGSPLYGSRLR